MLQDLCQRSLCHHSIPQQVSIQTNYLEIHLGSNVSINIFDVIEINASFYRENKPQKGGICVANHTSPIDIVILANDGCYAMVGNMNMAVSTYH